MAKYLLNTSFVEEDFFSDSRLIAIGSAYQGHHLCWWFNQLFGLNFMREPEMDICIEEGKILPKKGGTLFLQLDEQVVDTETQSQCQFPVYRHELAYFDASLYLYVNRRDNKTLVTELKNVDYLLLIQYASYMEPENDLALNMMMVPGVSWMREIDIDNLKAKRNLII